MTKNLLFLAPLLATAAIAAGCGGSDSTSQPAAAKTAEAVATTAPAENELPTTDAPAQAQAEAPAEVNMAGSTFAPADIELKVGDTITFVNDDQIAHTATADGGAFDSGTMEPGATFDFTAQKAGTIGYVCQFHPGMTGTITVT